MKSTQKIIVELRELRDQTRAEHDKQYHKSVRAHLGVTTPLIDKTIKPYIKELSELDLLELADELWQSNIYDAMIAAARIISHKKIQPSQKLWSLIIRWMEDVDGWALEDNLARAAWKCISVNPEILYELAEWTRHPNMWIRRAALIFTLPFAKKGMNPEPMLRWIQEYAYDSDWFIQKAIGWWLRDLGEHNPRRVVQFLNKNWNVLQPIARKESTRKLDESQLKKIIYAEWK